MTTNGHESTFAELQRDGYTVLRGLVAQNDLARFEQQIATLTHAQLTALNLTPRHGDPFIDLFSIGGAYTSRLYQLLERLAILQELSVGISSKLKGMGFFEWSCMEVPLVWPDIRADLPGKTDLLLPVHQDFGSMHCQNAYRLWIPLRPSNAETGTMCVYPGTHKQGPVEHDLSDPLKPKVDADRYDESAKLVFDLPAGDGVLIDPLLFHASVPNQSGRTKFTLMIQVQDLTTIINPEDEQSRFSVFGKVTAARTAARRAAHG
jgi:hypothetical protein